jgi:hypothetical protein
LNYRSWRNEEMTAFSTLRRAITERTEVILSIHGRRAVFRPHALFPHGGTSVATVTVVKEDETVEKPACPR